MRLVTICGLLTLCVGMSGCSDAESPAIQSPTEESDNKQADIASPTSSDQVVAAYCDYMNSFCSLEIATVGKSLGKCLSHWPERCSFAKVEPVSRYILLSADCTYQIAVCKEKGIESSQCQMCGVFLTVEESRAQNVERLRQTVSLVSYEGDFPQDISSQSVTVQIANQTAEPIDSILLELPLSKDLLGRTNEYRELYRTLILDDAPLGAYEIRSVTVRLPWQRWWGVGSPVVLYAGAKTSLAESLFLLGPEEWRRMITEDPEQTRQREIKRLQEVLDGRSSGIGSLQ